MGLTTFKLKIVLIWAIDVICSETAEGAVTLSRKMLAGWVRVNAFVANPLSTKWNRLGESDSLVFQDEAD